MRGSQVLARAAARTTIVLLLAVFGSASHGWGWLEPGEILVADRTTGAIRQFSSQGEDLGVFANVIVPPFSGATQVPWSLATDAGMNIYLSADRGVIFKGDVGDHSPFEGQPVAAGVIKFAPSGERVLDVSLSAPNFTTGGGIAALGNSEVIVGNFFTNDGAMVVDASGTGSTSIYEGVIVDVLCCSTIGLPPNLALIKRGVAEDLWIVGQHNGAAAIARFSLATLAKIGSVATLSAPGGPAGLAISKDGTLYIGNRGVPGANGARPELTIDRWSPTGDFLGTFVHAGVVGTDYGFDLALDFDAQGNLYVLNTITGELRKFSPSGVDGDVIASGFGTYGDVVVVRGGPTTKEQCKDGGWQMFPRTFKNQGDCIKFVNAGQ